MAGRWLCRIRRLYLDLIGFPPTVEQLADKRSIKVITDSLLASKHYGERWGRHWLDVARYADTNGYSIDDHRNMWAWRDWVIKAFIDNKPYDEFMTEQRVIDFESYQIAL